MIALIQEFLSLIAALPQWLLVWFSPAMLLIVTIALAIGKKKNAFFSVAVALFGIGLFFVNSLSCPECTVAWIAFYLVYCPLVRLILLINLPRREKENRNEEIYRTFHEDLDLKEAEQPTETVQEKEEEIQLSHADALIAKLRAEELSPTDRLEADGIARSLDAFRGRALTDGERRTLNDCLGSILKLTAKYRL